MTIAFYENRARQPLSAATLVLVDVCQKSVTAHREAGALATQPILARCQLALAAARRAGVPVVFVHDQRRDAQSPPGTESRWFAGFEPRRYESVVASTGPSCYASPYFSEILDGAGRSMLLAGLLSLQAATATALDAQRHGHRLTLLGDAVGFDGKRLIRESHAPAPTDFGGAGRGGPERLTVQAITTEDWLAEITPATPPARPARWLAGSQLRR
jgi:nicotinamidase-related amidase